MWCSGDGPAPATTPATARTHTAEFKRQTGGMSLYALITLHVTPLPGHTGVLVENLVDGEELPIEYTPGVLAGIADAAAESDDRPPVGGFRVTVLDARQHVIDSSEIAFRMATRSCLTELFRLTGLETWTEGTPAPVEAVADLAERVVPRLESGRDEIAAGVNEVLTADGFEHRDRWLLARPVDDVIQVVGWQGSAPMIWSGIGVRLGLVLPAITAFFDLDDPFDDVSRFPHNHLGRPLGLLAGDQRFWPVEEPAASSVAIEQAWAIAGRPYLDLPAVRSCAGLLDVAEGRPDSPAFYIADPLHCALIWHCRGADQALEFLDSELVPKQERFPWSAKDNTALRSRIEFLRGHHSG